MCESYKHNVEKKQVTKEYINYDSFYSKTMLCSDPYVGGQAIKNSKEMITGNVRRVVSSRVEKRIMRRRGQKGISGVPANVLFLNLSNGYIRGRFTL